MRNVGLASPKEKLIEEWGWRGLGLQVSQGRHLFAEFLQFCGPPCSYLLVAVERKGYHDVSLASQLDRHLLFRPPNLCCLFCSTLTENLERDNNSRSGQLSSLRGVRIPYYEALPSYLSRNKTLASLLLQGRINPTLQREKSRGGVMDMASTSPQSTTSCVASGPELERAEITMSCQMLVVLYGVRIRRSPHMHDAGASRR